MVELRNDTGKYNSPGAGSLSVLDTGCQLGFSPGYITSQGHEVSAGLAFWLDAYEHTSTGGRATLLLHAVDGWRLLAGWQARHQFRWNKDSEQMSVKQILEFVLARVGLKLEVKSESAAISGFYPDFAISPGDGGREVIQKLLSFVPDVLFVEGNKAYLVNLLSTDASVYSYGVGHSILEGRYKCSNWRLSRVQVEGFDTGSSLPVIVDSFAWNEIDRLYDRLVRVEDRNIGTVTGAEQRGEAYLREADIASASGHILVPVNCGQQLYDVIDVTDSRAGLTAAKRRILGMTLVYLPRRGQYEQRLLLGAV